MKNKLPNNFVHKIIITGLYIIFIIVLFLYVYVRTSPHDDDFLLYKIKKVNAINYTCDKNQKVSAKYDNSIPGKGKAYVSFGHEINREMITVISASGARYTDGNYVWWTKGNTGFLTEAWGNEKMLYNNCITNK